MKIRQFDFIFRFHNLKLRKNKNGLISKFNTTITTNLVSINVIVAEDEENIFTIT